MDELIADDYVEQNPMMPGPIGKQATIELMRSIYAALPDLHRTIEVQVAEGDRVVDRITYRGTHSGDFMGIPATGKPVAVSGILLPARRRQNRGSLVDLFAMMQQLGVSPPLGGSP